MNKVVEAMLSKVPQVTLGFWIIKILAATLGETGGDWVTMSMLHADTDAQSGGYLIGSAIFILIFLVAVAAQISTKRFHPFLYWVVIIATTTLGTTVADFCDRSLGGGYALGTAVLFVLLICSLAVWHWSEGSIHVNTVRTPKTEAFYWGTILFSQTLGTALGDFAADAELGGLNLGYEIGALVFGVGLAIIAALYFFTNVNRVALFWTAFILTRPLGATVGDLLDKPLASGGLALSRFYASGLLIIAIVVLIALLPQRPGEHPGERRVIA